MDGEGAQAAFALAETLAADMQQLASSSVHPQMRQASRRIGMGRV